MRLSPVDWPTVKTVAEIVGLPALVAAIATALWRETFGRALRWLWWGFKHLDPLRGLKHNQAVVMADIGLIKSELKPNGGSSLRDQVNLIRDQVSAMSEHQGLNRAIIDVFMDGSSEMLWFSDLAGRQLKSNRALVEMTGRRPEELRGWGWLNVIHPDDRARVKQNWMECVGEDRDFSERCRCQTLSDEVFDVTLDATPLRSESGKVLEWLGRARIEAGPFPVEKPAATRPRRSPAKPSRGNPKP